MYEPLRADGEVSLQGADRGDRRRAGVGEVAHLDDSAEIPVEERSLEPSVNKPFRPHQKPQNRNDYK